MALLEVHDLQVHFRTATGVNRAVDGLSFGMDAGEALAIVGESGCGKSVTSMSILRLLPTPPGKIAGRVLFRGQNLLENSEAQMRALRGKEIGMIFQEPMTSLNPVFSIGQQKSAAVSTRPWRSRRRGISRLVISPRNKMVQSIMKAEHALRDHVAGEGSPMQGSPLIEVRDMVKYFPITGGVFGRVVNHVKAVDGVSFEIARGETLALVGESGCGKSTVGKCLTRLIPLTSGEVRLGGQRIDNLSDTDLKSVRKQLNIIFQDPFSSLNPRMNVEALIAEPLRSHGIVQGKAERKKRVGDLLERVGLPREDMSRMPHQFSGGQRQRICIARALASDPAVVVCDEAVSALDVSVQAQIINLLMELQADLGLTMLFISHDLAVIEHMSDRVAVMYLGRIVEIADRDTLFRDPRHPYTKALLSAVPLPDPEARRERIFLKGDVPSPIDSPSGCCFRTRCPIARKHCAAERPELRSIRPGQQVACHYVEAEQA